MATRTRTLTFRPFTDEPEVHGSAEAHRRAADGSWVIDASYGSPGDDAFATVSLVARRNDAGFAGRQWYAEGGDDARAFTDDYASLNDLMDAAIREARNRGLIRAHLARS